MVKVKCIRIQLLNSNMSFRIIIVLVVFMLLHESNCRAQLTLSQEVCELAKFYIENGRTEFRCEFTAKNIGRETVTIEKNDFELPCTCTSVELYDGLIAPGKSVTFSVVYVLDPINTDTYEDHLKEFKEEGGRHQEIPLRIAQTSQEFTLMLNYFLKGLE